MNPKYAERIAEWRYEMGLRHVERLLADPVRRQEIFDKTLAGNPELTEMFRRCPLVDMWTSDRVLGLQDMQDLIVRHYGGLLLSSEMTPQIIPQIIWAFSNGFRDEELFAPFMKMAEDYQRGLLSHLRDVRRKERECNPLEYK